MDENLEKVHGLLSQVVRLSARSHDQSQSAFSPLPNIMISDDFTAPWSWTAAEVVSTEDALTPFLAHLSVAKDDVDGLSFCINSSNRAGRHAIDPVNCLDVSGRSPLHTAALNNSVRCTGVLLEAGALVHLRDSLGHTPLYYVCVKLHVFDIYLTRSLGSKVGLWDDRRYLDPCRRKLGRFRC
jgi:lysophospholipase